jgi:hypothetical protein
MNIFYLSESPKFAAIQQHNKHVVKMILESAQMLCTAHHELGSTDERLYKRTHTNHPSCVWVRQSVPHYMWLYNHMLELGEEYTRRYGRTHLTITKMKDLLLTPPTEMPDNGFIPPPQCMPEEYKAEDTVEAYQNYYTFKRELLG